MRDVKTKDIKPKDIKVVKDKALHQDAAVVEVSADHKGTYVMYYDRVLVVIRGT
jgi:hypothetical protein